MKNILVLFFLLFIGLSLEAQAQKSNFNYKTDYPIYLKRAKDPTSIYYYKKIEDQIAKADNNLSAAAILHLLIYTTALPNYNPVLLDTLCRHLYDSNEKGNYQNAIKLADSILKLVPINLTAVKEKALALKKLGRTVEFNKYSLLAKKTIDALLLSGDGYSEHPFFGVNYFDGITFYGAAYQCYPSKSGFMLDKKGRLLAAFYCYSQSVDNIMIQYFQMDHAKKYYKPNIKEGEE